MITDSKTLVRVMARAMSERNEPGQWDTPKDWPYSDSDWGQGYIDDARSALRAATPLRIGDDDE